MPSFFGGRQPRRGKARGWGVFCDGTYFRWGIPYYDTQVREVQHHASLNGLGAAETGKQASGRRKIHA